MKEQLRGKIKQLNKGALVLALLHFVLSFFTDGFVFRYVFFDFSSAKNIIKSLWTVGVKAVFLVLLLFLWQWLFWFVKKADRQFRAIALGYFGFMLVLLLLTWPGIWRMDEFGLLSSSIQLMPHFWQNYITSVFYIFSLMLLPFPAGVIILQCFCVSLIVARLVTLCLGGMKNKDLSKWNWLLLIPFFMFPVLDSNLYPLRMSLYAFLELLLIGEMFFFLREPNKKQMFFGARIIPLAAVVTVWRTESIYYFVFIPLFLLWVGKGKKYLKQIVAYLVITVIIFVPQKVGERMDSGQQYELTSVVLPLVPLVEEADARGEKELLEIIDRVVNVEVTLQGAMEGRSGINLFWGEKDFQRDYDSNDFAKFKSAYYKLILKFPQVFLKERVQTFVESSDLLENTTELFTKEGVPNYETFQTYPLTRPLSNDLRTSVIKALELRQGDDYTRKLPFTDMVYSGIPAMIILLIACVILCRKKQWQVLFLVLMILVKVPLVFLTAPSRLFMYYYSVYLFGYCMLFYFVWMKVKRKR